MTKHIAVAFAGAGDVRELTVESLLNDWLGFGEKDKDGYYAASDNEVDVYFPASAEHHNANLQRVVDWSAWADLPYNVVLQKNDRADEIETLVEDAEHVDEVANVNKALIDTLVSSNADEKYLVLLWGEEGDEDSENLATLAELKKIPIKDLTAGLDDLQFSDDAEEEPEPEPAPEPERPRRRGRGRAEKSEEQPEKPAEEDKPKRGRRGRNEAVETEDEPLTDDDVKDEEPEPTPKRERKAKPEPVEPLVHNVIEKEKSWGDAGAGHDPKPQVPPVVFEALARARQYFDAVDMSNALKNLAGEIQPSPLALLLGEAKTALEEFWAGGTSDKPSEAISETQESAAEPERPKRGRPRTREVTEAYLLNEEEGTYRKAGRGRPRRGETRVELAPSEVERLANLGVLDTE